MGRVKIKTQDWSDFFLQKNRIFQSMSRPNLDPFSVSQGTIKAEEINQQVKTENLFSEEKKTSVKIKNSIRDQLEESFSSKDPSMRDPIDKKVIHCSFQKQGFTLEELELSTRGIIDDGDFDIQMVATGQGEGIDSFRLALRKSILSQNLAQCPSNIKRERRHGVFEKRIAGLLQEIKPTDHETQFAYLFSLLGSVRHFLDCEKRGSETLFRVSCSLLSAFLDLYREHGKDLESTNYYEFVSKNSKSYQSQTWWNDLTVSGFLTYWIEVTEKIAENNLQGQFFPLLLGFYIPGNEMGALDYLSRQEAPVFNRIYPMLLNRISREEILDTALQLPSNKQDNFQGLREQFEMLPQEESLEAIEMTESVSKPSKELGEEDWEELFQMEASVPTKEEQKTRGKKKRIKKTKNVKAKEVQAKNFEDLQEEESIPLDQETHQETHQEERELVSPQMGKTSEIQMRIQEENFFNEQEEGFTRVKGHFKKPKRKKRNNKKREAPSAQHRSEMFLKQKERCKKQIWKDREDLDGLHISHHFQEEGGLSLESCMKDMQFIKSRLCISKTQAFQDKLFEEWSEKVAEYCQRNLLERSGEKETVEVYARCFRNIPGEYINLYQSARKQETDQLFAWKGNVELEGGRCKVLNLFPIVGSYVHSDFIKV